MTSSYSGISHDALNDGIDSSVSPTAVGAAGARSNVLANKLTNILSTSYADSEIRDALRILDGRGIRNDADSRRNLRHDAQKEVVDCNARIVNDFGQVAEQLKRVGAMLATLNRTCEEMRRHVNLAKQDSGPMLEEALVLMAQKQESETKQEILGAFKKHFIISDDDLTTLTSSVEPVSERFFTVLTRVKQIHKDCEMLLGSENQRLGTELMEQTSRNLDAAFKKLYSWVQREIKGLDLEDPHISGSIRRALRVLSERPTLFQSCLDFFAEAREQTLSDAFQAALTETTAAGSKAIEFSTHDLLRYIGDMLAWVHSTTVSEKEALEGLFIADESEIAKGLKASKSWSRFDDDGRAEDDAEPPFDGRRALTDLVSRNLASVCRTLQNRIEVAVRHSDEPVLIYKVLNLLSFYQTMFAKQVGDTNALMSTISDLEAFTTSHFEEVLEEENAGNAAQALGASDLSPPAFLTNGLHQLVDLVRTKGPQMTLPEFQRLFSALLSSSLNNCAEIATKIQAARRRSIFRLNYLSAVQSALTATMSQTDAATPSLEHAENEIAALKDELVGLLQVSFLEDSGVGAVLQETSGFHNDEKRRTWLLANLEEAARQLDNFLPSALLDAQDSMKPLIDKALAKNIIATALEDFCEEFDELEALLEQQGEAMGDGGVNGVEGGEENLPPTIRELYPRTGAEVRALLS